MDDDADDDDADADADADDDDESGEWVNSISEVSLLSLIITSAEVSFISPGSQVVRPPPLSLCRGASFTTPR